MAQQSHQSDPRILNRRTLERDHRRLAQLLRPGMTVLDVGCGTGAITAGIAKAVGPRGIAVGVDRDEANLAIGREEHRDIPNLRFENSDVLTLGDHFQSRFDIVTAARTLQWISNPDQAIRNMKNAAKPGGRLVILDYNLELTSWEPEPPAAFRKFYRAFLDWRVANNWDNRMAGRLPVLLQSAGLTEIEIHASDEVVERGDPNFFDSYASGIWLYVIQSLGQQLVQAGFLGEAERRRAEEEYDRYVKSTLGRQTHSMATVEGKVD